MLKPNHKRSTELQATRPRLCPTCGRKHDGQSVCLTEGARDMLTDVWRSMELLPPE